MLMERPDVTIANYDRMYDFYETLPPSAVALTTMHALSAAAYRGQTVTFDESAHEKIGELLETDTRLLIAGNHITMFDQFPVAAAVRSEPVLQPIQRNTFIPAKPSYFHDNRYRFLIDKLGAIPVFRPKDAKGDAQPLLADSTKRFIDVCAERVANGEHMFIFPEGTRKRERPEYIERVERGIGRIAAAASQRAPIAILPVALWYGQNPKKFDWVKPAIHFGTPILPPFNTHRDVTDRLTESLNHCVAEAKQSLGR